MAAYEKPKPCPFNEGVGCLKLSECFRCGWNPAVASERLHRIMEQRRKGGKTNEQKENQI